MSDPEVTHQIEELKKLVAASDVKASQAVVRADRAAEIALTAVETQKHFQAALEGSHTQMGEMLAATRKMTGLVETLARAALAHSGK